MNAARMKQVFLELYDKITNLAAPGYLDEEINTFLNLGQLEFVKTRYNSKGNQYSEGLEATEKRRKDLSELYRDVTLSGGSNNNSDQTGVSPNAEFFDLPKEFLYTMREEALLTSDDECIDGTRILVKPVTHDEYSINLNNPFKKPNKTKIWRLDYSRDLTQGPTNEKKRHEIVTFTGTTINEYYVRYIKIPTDINIIDNVDCELDASTHEEIISIAVRIAAGITDPGTYQLKVQEQKATE